MKLSVTEWWTNITGKDPRITLALAIALSGAMWFASTGVNHVWPLTWIAPLPLLLLIPDLGARRAAFAAFVASLIGALNLVVAYHALSPIVLVVAVLFVAVPYILVALAWRAIVLRENPIVSVLAYPVFIVIAEFLVSLISPNGTFGSIAYSQADVTSVIQIASVTGMWGISFILSLVPAALAVMWRHRGELRIVYSAVAVTVAPLVAILAFGIMRLAGTPELTQVRVGLATHDATIPYFETQNASDALNVVHEFVSLAEKLAQSGAEVIVLPEKMVGVTPAYFEEVISQLANVARAHHLTILGGFNLHGEPQPRNLALAIGWHGHVMLAYDKAHLVPGLEYGYKQGTDIGLIPAASGIIGVAICKDLDFMSLGRAYAKGRTSLMLVPAWDFVNDGWLHSRMAMLRGVEAGFAVARTATQGMITVSDAHGRMLAQRSSGEPGDVFLLATVPVIMGEAGTFYTRTGDWFAWLCIGIALVVGLRVWENRRAGVAAGL
jgi:apolipoprotein N-acyltransferase